ncbi:NUDIX hydrolase [Sessilibacter sp. MAH2]
MKFCSNCGAKVSIQVPAGDDRNRHVCIECETIHYQNPKVITGCLPVFEDKILLCKRAIEPRANLWTLPAGFMENGESIEEGALRESWEEARVKISNPSLYQVFSVPYINQVYVFYKGEVANQDFGPGPESLEVELFDFDQIPWDKLAFPVVRITLENYLTDYSNNVFPVHNDIVTSNNG